MKPATRKNLLHLHVCLAAFALPFLMVYMITGVLYTFGNKGAWLEQPPFEITLTDSAPNVEAIQKAVSAALIEKKLPVPSGGFSLKGENANWEFRWGGSQSDVVVRTTSDQKAEVKVMKASLHRYLVQLHKAKGGEPFKYMASFAFFCMFLVMLSGVLTGWQIKSYRYEIISMLGFGLIAFIITALLS